LLENIKNEYIKSRGIFFRSSIYEINISSKNFQINIKCSFKIFPISLKKIGNLLEENSSKLEFPHDFVKRDNLIYKGEHPYTKEKYFDIKKSCIEYCIRDCEIVQKFLLKIFENLKENEKKILLNTRSISSFSLSCFDKIFNNLKIETKTSIKIDKIIREAYFGGRCEVFGNKKENEKVFHFDFTGMYSEIMKEEFWFGKVKTKINPKDIYEPGFYTVEIYSKNIEIPILPFREDTYQKLLFPNGN